MKNHFTLIADPSDRFQPHSRGASEVHFLLHMDTAAAQPHFRSNFWHVMDSAQLVPHETAVDLYRIASTVYASDLAIPRSSGFDKWTREFVLHLPVSDVKLWLAAQLGLESLLTFLTGDRWEIDFRQFSSAHPTRDERAWKKGTKPNTRKVSLFSGGLDSFVGAVELTASGDRVCLVGHQDEGITKSRQDRLYDSFIQHCTKEAPPFLQVYLPAPGVLEGEGESSKRSRSFLFLALGTAVANALDDKFAELVVPENGFIALNVPLAVTRLGSLTTRTTHPHTLKLYQQLLQSLGLAVRVHNPYEFLTKGEMVGRVKSSKTFIECYDKSLSCAHPAASRWSGQSPGDHCGYCVPCLIRRGALLAADLRSVEPYVFDVLASPPTGGKSNDIRAFLLAIASLRTTSPLAKVLATGPLDPLLIGRYVDTFKRGLAEIEKFLKTRHWSKFE